MDDRNLMENMLLLEKGVCDLFMHGTIESSCSDVHQTFSNALNSSLCMQSQIYDKMSQKGICDILARFSHKMNSVKMKFSGGAGN